MKRPRTLVYVLLYLVILQVALNFLVPTDWIYHYRVEYDMAKSSIPTNLNLAMDRIAAEIRRNPSQDYIILLGDSVTYSGPGGPEQSIGFYLENWMREHGQPVRVYNLAQPAMLGADVYATLLLLKEHGIPLHRVVLNQLYSDFYKHPADVPLFSWMGDDLHRLDPQAWELAHGPAAAPASWQSRLRQAMLSHVTLWRYRDVLRFQLNRVLPVAASAEVKDTRPWTAKQAWLTKLMEDPMYQRFVDPRPLDLTTENPQVVLLRKMIREMDGARVLIWWSPLNQELMKPWVSKPEYQANAQRLDAFFASLPVDYVNLESAMPSDLFTDHVHLTPDGYRDLAAMLGQRLLAAQARH
jgi:hypothetical protein